MVSLTVWLLWRLGKLVYAWLRRPAEKPAPAHVTAVVIPPKRRRPVQRRPMLCRVRSYDARRRPVFCGPTAASALTGVDADELVRTIQQHRGSDRPVEGTTDDELRRDLGRFGFDMLPKDSMTIPTLACWARTRTDDEFERAWLLVADNHWVAVRGWWLCDSFYSKHAPMRITTSGPHRRTRVWSAYSIVSTAQREPGQVASSDGAVAIKHRRKRPMRSPDLVTRVYRRAVVVAWLGTGLFVSFWVLHDYVNKRDGMVTCTQLRPQLDEIQERQRYLRRLLEQDEEPPRGYASLEAR